MDHVIQKFFALHHYLILPGIGNFKIEMQPANLDFINRNITSSKNNIVFNTQPHAPTQTFYNFLASELHITNTHAADKFESYIKQLQQLLTQQNSIQFKTIGTINKQDDELTFTPAATRDYFPTLVAERVIRKNVSHTVRVGEEEKSSEEMQAVLNEPVVIKKDRWWIAASILAFIGIAAIVFYYASH